MLSRALGALGRILITAGTLILLFVAYQLWGTGLQEAKAQDELAKQFDQILAGVEQVDQEATPATSAPTSTSTPDGTTSPTLGTVPEPELRTDDLPLPETGEPIAKIRIPSIGVNRTVVESVLLSQLQRGPGHYPETPLPGQRGNVAIAGHRTTYGQPFHNLDKVETGDEVIFETAQGTFTYEITELFVVKPNQIEILEDKGDNRVTLIACHPKYSAAERLIAVGVLVGQPANYLDGQVERWADAAETTDPFEAATIDGGLSGVSVSKLPAILWGLAAAGVWFVTWLAQRALRRRTQARADAEGTTPTRGQRLLTWSPYLVGLPVFLVVLYVFFENFGRLLPANF